MSKLSRYILILTVCFSCIACSTEYKGEIPYYKPIPVLNGVLIADSTILIRLSWSVNPNIDSFPPIEYAKVNVFEDNTLIPSLTNIKGGYYKSDSIAKAGCKYTIQVLIEGEKELTAQTSIPLVPNTKVVRDTSFTSQKVYNKYFIETETFNQSIHSVYVFGFNYNSVYMPELNKHSFSKELAQLYCNSPFADRFNSLIYIWGPTGYILEFDAFVRFSIDDISSKKLATDIVFSNNNYSKSEITLLFASKEYDLYYKGGFIQRTQAAFVEEGIPTAYQPIYLPSNVLNGAGVFAGINLVNFYFDDK